MPTLKFADTHNMVAFLSKPTENDGFIVDFLNAHPIRYALTVNPTIYISCIEQFWSTAIAKTINGEARLHAKVDGKKIIITESSVKRDLRLADEEGKSTTTISSQQSHDKGKGITIEEPVKPKKKDQIGLDEEVAKKLQAEFDEKEILAREKAKKNKKPILL
nr:xylulose kinase-1 [Tanacetum cinerariifolium]